MSDINDPHDVGEKLPAKTNTEMLAEPTCQSQNNLFHKFLYHKTHNRERAMQHTNNKEQLNRKEFKNALKSIHQHTVDTQLNTDSKPIGTRLAKMVEEEQTLSQIARSRLAQLKSGYYLLLNSYLSRICDNVDNRCTKCDVTSHDVNPNLNCSKNTTDLKLIDLRERPAEVAKWLDSIASVLHDQTAQINLPSLPFFP